jgi:hypothetical protein
MDSEYIRDMAYGMSGGAIFYLLISLVLFAVWVDLLVWVLQTHHRKNKMFFQRVVMLLIASVVFGFFLIEGIRFDDLAKRLLKDSKEMVLAEEEGTIQDRYGYAHNQYVVINGESYICKENIDIVIGNQYKIEFYQHSKLIYKIEKND